MKLPENYFIAYLLWFISTALAIVSVFSGRVVLMTLMGLITTNHWRLSFAERASILLFGLIALGFVLFLENFYRQSVGRGRLWPRFLHVTIIQLAIIVVGTISPIVAALTIFA